MASRIIIGVDVGGTNTDAVAMVTCEINGLTKHERILAKSKQVTTSDITSGVQAAILSVLHHTTELLENFFVVRVHIGTTHFLNALLQKRDLARVSVIRLCGPASVALPPFSCFPSDLEREVKSLTYMVNGGYQFDGTPITDIDVVEIEKVIKDIRINNIKNIAVIGVFSPVRTDQEELVRDIILNHYPEASVTLSHEIGYIGLLERENASILNECLKPLCRRTLRGFRAALDELELACPFFITQNDGTIISENRALEFPVQTIASGPTNSMRGAAFISDIENAIVVDIGGTTTDVGALVKGFPRQANGHTVIADVRTNFKMPDVLSIALGGGSFVTTNNIAGCDDLDVQIGPLSAGYQLKEESLVFGNENYQGHLTATDIAVASNISDIGDKNMVADLSPLLVEKACMKIHQMIKDVIDRVKIANTDIPVILVGGGSSLINREVVIGGVSQIIIPNNHDVANAIGAALNQVSGHVDEVVDLQKFVDAVSAEFIDSSTVFDASDIQLKARNIAKSNIIEKAKRKAIQNGALPNTVKIVEYMDVALAYVPGNATRMKAKAVGELHTDTDVSKLSDFNKMRIGRLKNTKNMFVHNTVSKQTATSTGKLISSSNVPVNHKPIISNVNSNTGDWLLQKYDIESISIGSGILGCGGGGNPLIGRLRALRVLEDGGCIRIISPYKFSDKTTDLAIHVAFMGAPVVIYEKIVSGTEKYTALKTFQDFCNYGGTTGGYCPSALGPLVKKKGTLCFIEHLPERNEVMPNTSPNSIAALIPMEIGGLNGMEPLILSAETGLPVLDCDGMGRAFPELNMFTPMMYNYDESPACLSDEFGTRAVLFKYDSPKALEDHFRAECVRMGCSAGLAMSPLNKQGILKSSIMYSYSRAWKLGNAVLEARKENTDVISAVLEVENGHVLISGSVKDVFRRDATGGFTKGTLWIHGSKDNTETKMQIDFQNENLIARDISSGLPGVVMATTPDLICIVDSDTAEPIPTEEMRFGLRVTVLVLACPDILSTNTALKYIGPKAFGYDVNYTRAVAYHEPDPIPK